MTRPAGAASDPAEVALEHMERINGCPACAERVATLRAALADRDAQAEEIARLRGELGQHAYCAGPQKWGELFDEVHEEQDALRRENAALLKKLAGVMNALPGCAPTPVHEALKECCPFCRARAAFAPAPEET